MLVDPPKDAPPIRDVFPQLREFTQNRRNLGMNLCEALRGHGSRRSNLERVGAGDTHNSLLTLDLRLCVRAAFDVRDEPVPHSAMNP
jgi:hypothetical protein